MSIPSACHDISLTGGTSLVLWGFQPLLANAPAVFEN